MKSGVYQLGIATLSVACVFLFANCAITDGTGEVIAGKVTGGGWVDTGEGRANFGFNASSCEDPENPVGRFNFHDKNAPNYADMGGVKMNGFVLEAGQCDVGADCTGPDVPGGVCPAGGYLIYAGYKSTNPKLPGTGTAAACVVDNGEGANGTGDLIELRIDDGPYDGYEIGPGVIKGNIQAHLCED